MKTQSFHACVLILCLLLNFSCKKKKPGSSSVDLSKPTKVDGYITLNQAFTMNDPTLTSPLYGRAYFFKQPQNTVSLALSVPDADVGRVTLNDKELRKDDLGSGVRYELFAEVKEIPSLVQGRSWTIGGNESFPELKLTDNAKFPEYLPGAPLPDTLFKNRINTIELGSFSGAEEITISLFGSFGNIGPKTISPGDKTISFGPDDFLLFPNHFNEPGEAYLEIILSRPHYYLFAAKTIRVTNEARYVSKSIVLK